tara:strand:+ start:330 stop:623 length:294 start_codon:yes stop_codon:yes gene_type:complete
MTEEELNKLADLIVDKLLTSYVKEASNWYANQSFPNFYTTDTGKKYNENTEEDLLGELAKLMTQLNLYQEREEYEKCARIKKKIDKIKKKLEDLDTN